MLSKIPRSTSTPYRYIKLRSRRAIHDNMSDTEASPIYGIDNTHRGKTSAVHLTRLSDKHEVNDKKEEHEQYRKHPDTHEEEEDTNSEDSLCERSRSRSESESSTFTDAREFEESETAFSMKWSCLTVLSVLLILISIYYLPSYEEDILAYNNTLFLRDFKNQHEDFWLYIESGVNDVIRLKKTAVFLLIYKDGTENVVDKLIDKISQYAKCNLRDCSVSTVNIQGSSLADKYFTTDYGRIITKYKRELQTNGVMIVKNLEEVPYTSAQAFHSISDKFEPLVENALIVFTMKVSEIPQDTISYCERKLRNLWVDMEEDKFYPLYTRLSSVILGVYPEENV